ASTISQQLSSDIFGLKEGEKRGQFLRQLDRKFLEIAIAVRLEARFTKDELLEAYINQINWGRQIRGIGEASRIYFEKHPAELKLSESAMLAGIVRGPDAYNPFRSMEAAERERNTTLARMVAADKITREEAEAAKATPLEVRPIERRGSNESYAMNAIRNDLNIILEQEDIDIGGLIITTTIDKRLQDKAVEALDKRLTEIEQLAGYRHPKREDYQPDPEDPSQGPEYIQGAVVVIENRTGAALAVVGGRDVKQSRFNRAKYAKRQVGSLFKSFLYLAAFDRGMRPSTPVSDGPLRRGEIAGAGNWNPMNSDGKFGGMFPAAYGLIRSRNTMSIRVGNYAGMDRIQDVAKLAGFKEDIPRMPSSYLGTWEATPWEVASAYSIFPNEGERFRPYIISEIRDRDGNVLYSTRPISYAAALARSAKDVSGILQEVTRSGTAASVKRHGFTKPSAGKTGTTDNFVDAWFAGYTSQLTCAVWVGFDENKRTISSGYGSYLALPVWAEVMKTADELDYPAGMLHNPRKVALDICRLSGKRATTGCAVENCADSALLAADTAPAPDDKCPLHPARAIAIDPETGLPIAPKAAPVIPENTPRAAPRANPVPEARPPRAVPVR
ncbi:MAG: transglycosylase domain-containing protein, partial [Akkermansiaceae bacterium]|nr:transglycosylase domain-containing protein [Akkermansiaceae bacterium]